MIRKKDLAVVTALGALVVGFFLPARALSQDRVAKVKCNNNLKQLALGAIQYADDKRFFPHLGKISALDNEGKTLPTGNDVPGRCLRALIFFNYHDNPECFVCPESDDKAHPMSDAAKSDPKRFGWGGEDVAPQNPIHVAAANDKDADKLKDLSYSWTVRGMTTNTRSDVVMSGDRARRAGDGAKQTIQGNHRDGWNVVHVDAHTSFVKIGSEESSRLAATGPTGAHLVCWDEGAAGGPAAEKKLPEADPAHKAKARKLLDVGGFEAGLKSDLALGLAMLRAKADSADAYSKWVSELKTDEAIDKVAACFTRHMDAATIDGAVTFYESAAGKGIVQSQIQMAKARLLSALTEPERLARNGMAKMGGAGMRDGPRDRDLAVFDMIGMNAAVYVKTLSLENVDAGIAFYQSPAGTRYTAALLKAAEESSELVRGWLEKKLQEPGSPFAAVAVDGNEASAIGALKTIATSQAIFREGDKDANGELDYGTLEQLGKTMLVDGVLGSGKKQGYVFECAPGTESKEFLWWATASPEKPGVTGKRYFWTNQAGVIFYSTKPITVDKKSCKQPEGVIPVGR
ncbi:MAG: DUF2059 domain-containing protein [Planctomycetota bacterium]